MDVLLYSLKTSLICIHICPNKFGRTLEIFSFSKKNNTPIPSLTSPCPCPQHTETHSLIYFVFSRRQHSCNWGDSRWCRIRAANLGPHHRANVGRQEASLRVVFLQPSLPFCWSLLPPWDRFPCKINVLSELILFLKGESHRVVKTDHKKMHQSVRKAG